MVELNAGADEQCLTRCYEQVEALAEQLAAAIDAIAHNRLTALEQSIEAQQHCLAKLLVAPDWMKEVNRSSRMPQTYAKLRASVRRLVQLNKQYSALLEHTSRSLQMLQAMDPEFVLTALRSNSELNLARSVSRDFARQPALSWHG